ncbi:MAG TPA: hypothetical protein VMH85_10350, partial [Terriglobales bacterium]|nr:hypothetical protein [Terriglobales bacterium]
MFIGIAPTQVVVNEAPPASTKRGAQLAPGVHKHMASGERQFSKNKAHFNPSLATVLKTTEDVMKKLVL